MEVRRPTGCLSTVWYQPTCVMLNTRYSGRLTFPMCNSRSMLVELGCERVIGFKTLDLRATSASMACMRHERASAKATAGLHLRLPHWPCGHVARTRATRTSQMLKHSRVRHDTSVWLQRTHGHGKTRVCSCERDSACGQVATAETRTPNNICPGGNTGRTVGAEFGVLAVMQLQL